jgi:hypothetical protein
LASAKVLGVQQNFDLAFGKKHWDWITGVAGEIQTLA